MSHIKTKISSYFFVIIALLMAYLTFLILKPIITPIVTAGIIAFLFYPLYKKIYKKTNRKHLSAFIVSFLIILIIVIPTYFVVSAATRNVSSVYSELKVRIDSGEILPVGCEEHNIICKTLDNINKNNQLRYYLDNTITSAVSSITRQATSFIFSIPKRIIDIVIIFFLVFFLLIDGFSFVEKARELLPLKKEHTEKLVKKFFETIKSVVYGYLVVAALEGIIGGLAFFIAGIKGALLWGIIIGLMGLIPMIGAVIIWVPMSIFQFATGHPFSAIVLITAGLIIMFMDTVLRAKIIGSKVFVHPALVAIGVLGGIMAFGGIGIVMGPLILVLLITIVEIYQTEKDSII